jgi:hypothetical protein
MDVIIQIQRAADLRLTASAMQMGTPMASIPARLFGFRIGPTAPPTFGV